MLVKDAKVIEVLGCETSTKYGKEYFYRFIYVEWEGESAKLSLNDALARDCTLRPGDRIAFEAKLNMGKNRYHDNYVNVEWISASSEIASEQTGSQCSMKPDINMETAEAQTEAALDDIFGPASEEAIRKMENRKAVEEKMNPILREKRQQLVEEQNQPITKPLFQTHQDNEEPKLEDLVQQYNNKRLIGFF